MHRSFLKVSVTSLLSLGFVISSIGIAIAGNEGRNTASIPSLKNWKNWGILNTRAKSHISAVDAWTIQEGSKDIVVAVIDTGIDVNHPLLEKNIWHSATDKSKAGGVYGWNYVSDKANPFDDHGHGTHVAGIIGALADSKTGVSGVAHKVSIMAVKYYSDSNPGSVNLRNTVKAIEYAVKNGARIINYSGGGSDFSEDEYVAIRKAEAAGILFVAAAGNDSKNVDNPDDHYYPSSYGLSNIISVAATDIENKLLHSSNWGKKKVDVAAPGDNIFSTLPGGKFGYMSGTSQATAFVSGMAALLLSQDPSLTPVQIKEIIVGSVDKFPQLADKIAGAGRVNAYSALLTLQARSSGKKTSASIQRSAASATPSLIRILSNDPMGVSP